MISIISLNWNTTNMLIRLYESLTKNTSEKFEFIIVDNGSIDSEWDKLKKYFKLKSDFDNFWFDDKKAVITIQKLSNNIGFSAGNNVGLQFANKENNIAFINSDIIVNEENWDKKFNEELGKEKIGVVGCAYHPLIWDRSGNFHVQPIPNETVESESVQGAFFAIRNSLFNELMEKDGNIFDEDFKYAHYEETDLCFRIRKMGYKVLWIPIKHVHDHNNSATKHNGYHLNDEIKNQADFKANSERNKQLLVRKHFS